MNTSEQVSPNRMLFIGEADFLVSNSIFLSRINVLLGDITGVTWRVLIFYHDFHLSNKVTCLEP